VIGRRTLIAGLVFASSAHAQTTDLRALARRAATWLAPLHAMYLGRNRDIVERGQKLNRLIRESPSQNGSLRATAWLDLSAEPMFLTLPRMNDTPYSAVLLDPFQRTVAEMRGPAPRPWIVGSPGWNGVAESGVDAIRAPCRSVWLRYVLDDAADAARALLLETPDEHNQRRILEMQELMRYRTDLPPEPVADWPAPRPADPFVLYETGLAMLGECLLGADDKRMLEELAPLHLRPGRHFDARAFSAAERDAIVRGIADAAPEIAAAKALLE
jgi:hypothetical protein